MAEHERSVSIRFPPDLLEALKRIAEEDARSLNSEVVWALRQFVEQRREEQDTHAN